MNAMPHLLIVEDDGAVRDVWFTLLTEAGYGVDQAASYASGLDALEATAYDLVVIDALLPGGSGLDLATLAEMKGVRTLIVTGHPEGMRALEQHAKPYVAKPFGADVFLAKVLDRLSD
jgi:two-component system phosphate regulon response regulator OmpR